jgi:hypothetical protein
MDKVQKHNSFNTNTPSSESYKNYSQNILPTCIFWLTDLSTLSVSLRAAFSIELPCLKPNCSETNILVVCI